MATAKKTPATQERISIPAIEVKTFDLRIVGDSPLICHAWSEKAKLMMLQKQQKKASAGKEARRPMVEYAESLYWISEKPDFTKLSDEEIMAATQKGRFGFPVLAFKAAAVNGAFQQKAIDKKTTLRGGFHLIGELAEIEGTPIIREDMTRIAMGTADLRYRAEFTNWSTTLHVKFNSNAVSMEQVVNALNIGGFSNGIGDWRPERDGTYGTYHVE